jgi:hypothetical protein
MEFRGMGDTLRLRSHASISAEVTSRIGPGQAAADRAELDEVTTAEPSCSRESKSYSTT